MGQERGKEASRPFIPSSHSPPSFILHPSPSLYLSLSLTPKILMCTQKKETSINHERIQDSMPRSREEMLPIMRFFARRLRSRGGVPEGAVEV